MNDLVDRYIWAVVKRLPAEQRDDVADELRATIADMLEGRGAGRRPASATCCSSSVIRRSWRSGSRGQTLSHRP